MFCKAQERLKRYLNWSEWKLGDTDPWNRIFHSFLHYPPRWIGEKVWINSNLILAKNYVQKMSQILLGGGLEEHCWDNVLVALVLLNFRPPTVAPSWTQYHAAPHSTPECPTVPPPARILFPKRGFLFPYLTEENKLIIITIYLVISCLHCFLQNFSQVHALLNFIPIDILLLPLFLLILIIIIIPLIKR